MATQGIYEQGGYFDLQESEFEFSALKADLGEIQNQVEIWQVIEEGKHIVTLLVNLGLREVVVEAAQLLLDRELVAKATLDELSVSCFDKLLVWFKHVCLRFISYMLLDTNTLARNGYIWCDKIEHKLAVSFTQNCTKEFLRLIQEFP